MVHKILLIAPNWVGDTIIANSLMQVLHQKYQDLVLDVVAIPWSAPILERMREVNQVWLLPVKHNRLNLMARYRLAQQLKKQNYDQVIVIPNSWKSALVPWLARIKLRTGWLGEWRYGLLNQAPYLSAELKTLYPRIVDRYVALAHEPNSSFTCPLPRLNIDKSQQQRLLSQYKLNLAKPVLALSPGAAFGPAKRWPIEHFAALLQTMLAEGWQVWLFGSKNDQKICQQILDLLEQVEPVAMPAWQADIVNFSGKLVLTETVDLLALSSVLVANDSGLMHMAAAVETPVVAIYGSTPAEFAPPLAERVRVFASKLECSPCKQRTCRYGHYQCLYETKPSMVVQAVRDLHD